MKRYSLRNQLMILVISINLVGILGGLIDRYAISHVSEKYALLSENTYPKVEFLNEMYLDYRKVHISLLTIGLQDLSEENVKKAMNETKANIEKFERDRKSYLDLGSSPGQQVAFDGVLKEWEEFRKVAEFLIPLGVSKNPGDIKKFSESLSTSVAKMEDSFNRSLDAAIEFHQKDVAETLVAAHSNVRKFSLISLILGVFGGAGGLLFGLWLAQSISKKLNAIYSDLAQSSSEVSGSANALNSSSDALAAAATEQAEALQETAAAVEEIRSVVVRNAESAAASVQVSQNSQLEASQGNGAVQEMIDAIGEIKATNSAVQDEINNNNKAIGEIVSVINHIAEKTKMIDTIVFQTKILSFNASIEAARAGEAGQGFSVVAEEVGKLAEMSGQSAKEIASLLETSMKNVNSMVKQSQSKMSELVNQASAVVERGYGVSQKCGDALKKIVHHANQVSENARGISASSREQAVGMDEIAKAVHQLDHVTQLNAQETQNTSGSAASLLELVKTLNVTSQNLHSLVQGESSKTTSSAKSFIWRDQYSLKIEEMDAEHKILIQKINVLVKEIQKKRPKPMAIEAAFTDLGDYTRSHFSDEEAYLSSIKYPDLEGHKVIHHNLLAKLDTFAKDLQEQKFDGAMLIGFLNDWLIQHILGVDMKYSRFVHGGVRSAGSKRAA